MRKTGNVYAAKDAIRRLLESRPSRYQLVCRIGALTRLQEDCERFFPNEVLRESLGQDIRSLCSVLEVHHLQPASNETRR